MNLSQEAGNSTAELLFVNFNQDATSLSVGTKSGYKLFPLNSIERLEPSFEKDGGEVCIIERLFASSLVAMVELANPRKLRVCHFKKNSEICTYSYPDTILSVKLNRQRLVVVLRQNLYIHNIRDMKVMHTIRDTPKNPSGLCALSVDNDNGYIAYPGSSQSGEVQVFDVVNLKAVAAITAHDTPLAALTFNVTGTKLATASTTGTVIRVFSIPQGEKLFEFRRGMKRFIQINCLSFSVDDMYLVTSSSTETVHVFRLIEPPQEKPAEEQQGWMSYIGKAFTSPVNYLPTHVTEAFTQSRAFAQLKLPKPGEELALNPGFWVLSHRFGEKRKLRDSIQDRKPGFEARLKSVCTVASIEGAHRVLVATSEGLLYVGNIDPKEGGECKITKEFGLVGDYYHDEDSSVTSAAAGLTSYRQQSYASVASHSAASLQGHAHSGLQGGHMTQPSDSHEQRPLKLAEEDDEQPPSTHTIQT